MYCIHCGHHMEEGARFCSLCATPAWTPQTVSSAGLGVPAAATEANTSAPALVWPSGGGRSLADHALRERSVLAMVLLSAVTFGIYEGFWLLRTRDGLNQLSSARKIGVVGPALMIVLFSFYVVVVMVIAVLEAADLDTAEAEGYQAITLLGAGVITLMQRFRVRAILREHYGLPLSRVATFFLGPFYLQDRMNLIVRGWLRFPPGAAPPARPPHLAAAEPVEAPPPPEPPRASGTST